MNSDNRPVESGQSGHPFPSTVQSAADWLERLRLEETSPGLESPSSEVAEAAAPTDSDGDTQSVDQSAPEGVIVPAPMAADKYTGGSSAWKLGAAAALALVAGGLAWAYGRSTRDADHLRKVVGTLSESRQLLVNDVAVLQKALDYLRPTSAERRADVFTNYVEPTEVEIAEDQTHDVKVTVKNVRFPVVMRWTSGDVEKTEHLPSGDSQLTLPARGMTTIFCEPIHGRHWYQVAGIGLPSDEPDGFAYQGSTLGKITASLADHNRLLVFLNEPAPPWNATLIPVQGDWALVTLDRPWGDFEIERWINDRPQDSEELPNTATYWARDGSEGLAEELADYFVANRGTATGRWGRFRGRKHTNIVVPATQDAVREPFLSIPRDELAKHLVTAFELIRKKRPPVGRSIEEEIAVGRQSLERLGVRKP